MLSQPSYSSDTGDVLIRSTRAQRLGALAGSGSVQITVQKLRSPPHVQPPRDSGPARREAARCEAGHELLTSRFATGSRGAVLEALRHRSHSAPHRREVSVQLLDPAPLQAPVPPQDPPGLSSQDASDVVQTEAALISGHQGDASNTPAAPVIKVCVQAPSDMDARVSQLADGVQKLLDADRGWSQALQHMETLQSQQLQLQGQLLESTLRIVRGHAPATSDRTASGHRGHQRVTHRDNAESGFSNQQSFSASIMETSPVAMETGWHDRWPKQNRDDRILRRASGMKELRASEVHTEEKALLKQPEEKTARPAPALPHHTHTQPHQTQHRQDQLCQTKHQKFPSQQTQSQETQSQSQKHQAHQNQIQRKQRRPVVPSMLEEAGQVLRHVRRQKKLLEENLQTLLRAETGEVLHCQLEALSANRDCSQEVRIKKTVDAWISTLARDIEAEMSSEDATAAVSSAHLGRGKPVSRARGTGSRAMAGRRSRGPAAVHRPLQAAQPDRLTDSKQVGVEGEEGGESYLTRLYGRAPYEGLRRTLKKSPYLHFSSPASPLSKKPRPRLVESVRGVKLKSCKTQTSTSPGPPQHDPAHLTITPPDSHAVSVAIPLGPPRMDSSFRGGMLQEVPPVSVDCGAPEQQQQQLAADEAPRPPSAPPPSAPPSHTVDIIDRESEEEAEQEDNICPGTDFLSVVDVQEESSVLGEEAVELDGGPSPPAVLYQGPLFPPEAPRALPAKDEDPLLGINPQQSVLENRLVEWVEQQLMAQMISDMHRPPPADPAHSLSSDQSQLEEHSVTSDIVEAAGGGGLQLFVDSNMSVDSELIRELVNEVLTETIALMLGERDTPEPGAGLKPSEPEPAAQQQTTLVSTPVPTPPPSTAPPSTEATPVITPPPSEPASPLSKEPPQPITVPDSVATPTPSPEPAPPAGAPSAPQQALPTYKWENAELPPEEEPPEEEPPEEEPPEEEPPEDTHNELLLMSVAQEEPPLASPLPPPSPPSEAGPASPCSSSEDSSSSSSSSSAVTAGTEAALRHISEGELLISVNQLAAMTEEAAACSFSSSLQELQDMELDPPSEGQVKGHSLLLTRVEQGVTLRGDRPQPEGSWGREEEKEWSVGEVQGSPTVKPGWTTVSPGQISQCADVSAGSFEGTNQVLCSTVTADRQTVEEQQGGSRRMEPHLPPQEELMEAAAAADTDSSTSDVF